jgi:UDP-N-acetylmuramoyl-tripeptide--D-alanyl-D-alanine ligase
MNRNHVGGFTEAIAFCNPWKTRYAVFEVGAGQAGKIEQSVKLIKPDISVVISVFLEHRSLFKTVENVACEKAGLLKCLPPGGVAVLNADDPLVAGMPVPPGRKLLTFGSSSKQTVSFDNAISAWPQLLRFTAVIEGQRQEIQTRMLGTHWIGAIMAAMTVAHHLGVPLEQMARVIRDVPAYPGRMQVMMLPSGAVVIRDEFKGSAHTITVAFDEISKADARRKILVFGDVSESSASPRKRLRGIGQRAAELFDYVLFIGEKSYHGVFGAVNAWMSEERALAVTGSLEAAEFLKPMLSPGDVMLLKADINNFLPRLFYSLLGTVSCTIPICRRTMVCDDCWESRNSGLVKMANEQLAVKLV